MNQSMANHGLATSRARDNGTTPVRHVSPAKAHRTNLQERLASLQRDYAELHTAIFEAAQVHRRLCAPRLLQFADIEIASEIFAVRHLPGDFFTVEQKDGEVILALGDICGKGLAAGMWTTHVAGLVQAHATRTSIPEEIIHGVNSDLCLMSSLRPFASLFLAKLDPITGLLNYCSAGHPPALLLRANGEIELLSEGGLLLGVLSDAVYAHGTIQLDLGDTLLVYSDGIVESRNNASDEFGSARLEKKLRQAPLDSADSVLFSLLGAVQDFAGTRPLVDDMTVAVVRRADVAAATVPAARAA